MSEVKHLGKKLKLGDTFVTVTKRMTKNRTVNSKVDPITRHKLNTYEVLRDGDIRILEKGKRKYVCKIIGLVETRTGLYVTSFTRTEWWNRWWQFSYLVKILEN